MRELYGSSVNVFLLWSKGGKIGGTYFYPLNA